MDGDISTGSTASLRRMHRGLALRQLLVEQHASRMRLAERLGLSSMAVTRIVRDLMTAGLVEEGGPARRAGGPGRNRTLIQIKPDGVFAAGILLSAYPTEIVVVDALGVPLAQRQVHVAEISNGAEAVQTLAHALNGLIDELALPRDRIAGVGIVVAADLDANRRRVLSSGFLGWSPFDLITPVEQITGLPATAEKVSNALALAETAVGLAKSMTDVVVVRAGTLLGAAMVNGGRIVRGNSLRAGRLGHLHHAQTSRTCSCGRNECLNTSASGWAILCALGLVDHTSYDPKRVGSYATAIDSIIAATGEHKIDPGLVAKAMHDAGEALACGLHALDLIFEPEAIIVDGPLSRSEAFMGGIASRLSQLGESGGEILAKLKRGEIRSVRAAAILALLERVYSASLDFDALCASAPHLEEQSRNVEASA